MLLQDSMTVKILSLTAFQLSRGVEEKLQSTLAAQLELLMAVHS
jgi:hypothetical protein